MRRLFARAPSPAAALAFIALVAALSGSAIALPGTGSVDSGDVKNNAIRTKDIRNNDVRSKDVRNNTLTGNDVNESKLGKVPSAGNADNAATAANAVNASNSAAVGGYRIERVAPFTLTDGQTKDVATIGPFSFTARCRINFDPDGGGGPIPPQDVPDILIATSVANAAFDGDDMGVLNPATPEEDRAFVDGTAIAPDGTEIVGSELYAGVNILNQPGVCRFGGFFTIG